MYDERTYELVLYHEKLPLVFGLWLGERPFIDLPSELGGHIINKDAPSLRQAGLLIGRRGRQVRRSGQSPRR